MKGLLQHERVQEKRCIPYGLIALTLTARLAEFPEQSGFTPSWRVVLLNRDNQKYIEYKGKFSSYIFSGLSGEKAD